MHAQGVGELAENIDMVHAFLAGEELRKLGRDLQILIATNGTLTRILNVVAGDEIVVQIVAQDVHSIAPDNPGLGQLPSGRVLRRRTLLTGRTSGEPFVAAESFIAIDPLPPSVITSLAMSDRPIGEVMTDNYLETFKEAAQVWIGEVPGWVRLAAPVDLGQDSVARRYRVICGGQPVMIITEYFLRSVF